MKVVIPVAGLGSRLKPHTFSTAKPLLEVAGKPIIDAIIEDVKKLKPSEIAVVIGYKGELIRKHLFKQFPKLPFTFIEQKVMDGDGSAVKLGLDAMRISAKDELFVVFGDTMVDMDYTVLEKMKSKPDCFIFTMKVKEPQHYGVVEVSAKSKEIVSIEEKPEKPKSDLAIIGAYYFRSATKAKERLDAIAQSGKRDKGEFQLTQLLVDYLEDKKMSVKHMEVRKWFDCGRPHTLLDANRYFLEKRSKHKVTVVGDSLVIGPSYVAEGAVLKHSIIGPYACVAEGAVLENCSIQNSIISAKSKLKDALLRDSIVGKEVAILGRSKRLNIGEKSEFVFD